VIATVHVLTLCITVHPQLGHGIAGLCSAALLRMPSHPHHVCAVYPALLCCLCAQKTFTPDTHSPLFLVPFFFSFLAGKVDQQPRPLVLTQPGDRNIANHAATHCISGGTLVIVIIIFITITTTVISDSELKISIAIIPIENIVIIIIIIIIIIIAVLHQSCQQSYQPQPTPTAP
jgi:amino acid transporter